MSKQQTINKASVLSRLKRLSLVKWLKRLLLLTGFLLLCFKLMDWLWPLPIEDFEQRHFAQVVVDKHGKPLRAFADSQGVWRYPVTLADVSPLYIEALLNYEDRYFYQHFGVNPLAVLRAIGQRITEGRFVSGASTLTMQVARILKPHKKSLSGKLAQMFRALQLEWHYSKEEILTFYLNYAPFGGPIEGVQAASYTYLGKPAAELSHSEAALLAVLPQAPSRYRPDRYAQLAAEARNKVLDRLVADEIWSKQTVKEAKEEPIWASNNARPMLAPLLTRRLSQRYPQQSLIKSTLDIGLQTDLEWMLRDHINRKDEQVSAAILVIDNSDLSTLAYLGSADYLSESRQGYVDMITAVRSPGSTLKPFIYGMAIDEGLIHAQSLLFDVPQSFAGYRPKNFTDDFSGPVSMSQALVRSLNMPAVQVIDELTPETFYVKLKNAGLNLRLPEKARPNLSLALGGGGVTMEELVGVFAGLGRQGQSGQIRLAQQEPVISTPLLSEGAAWIIQHTLAQASMKSKLNRRHMAKTPGIAFKTGTSYGFRDAWVLASNAKVTVGVWVGQPDGSFLVDNSGRQAAVPLLNQVLAILPDEMHQAVAQPFTVDQAVICWPLGYRQSAQQAKDCHQRKTAYLLDGVAPPTLSDPMNQLFAINHLALLLDQQSGLRVTPDCADGPTEVKQVAVWPLLLEPWLPQHLKREQLLKPFSEKCALTSSQNRLSITGIHDRAVIYPEVSDASIPDIQLELAGSSGTNYWFLNGHLLSQSSDAVTLSGLVPGQYELHVIDSSAQHATITFEVQM